MARKLNNPEMPMLAYRYDVRIIGEIPKTVEGGMVRCCASIKSS
jgi:hypothetical protein